MVKQNSFVCSGGLADSVAPVEGAQPADAGKTSVEPQKWVW